MINNFAVSKKRFCSVNRAILQRQQREHKGIISAQARREEKMTWCVDGKSQTEHSLQGVGDGGKLKLLGNLDLPYNPWESVPGQGCLKGQARSVGF